MASFDMRIELERPSAEYRPGEAVSGAIVVTAESAAVCKALTVESAYRAHGAGDEAKGVDERVDLGRQAFDPGTHRVPFSITAPDGPLSYSGKVVHLDWELRARADVDWAIDPKAEHSFRLLAWTREAATTGPVFRAAQRAVREEYVVARGSGDAVNKNAMPPGCATTYGGCLVVAAALVALLWHVPAGWMVAAVLGVSGVVCLGWGLPKVLARKALGAPTLEIVPESLHAGENIEVGITFTPGRRLEELAVTLELSCTEIALKQKGSGSDSSTETFREVVMTEQALLLSDWTAPAGEAVTLHGGWTIPEGGPPTLRLSNNEVRWEVSLDAKWRSGHHRETRPITVLPARIS